MIEQEIITDYWSSVRDIIDKVCVDYDASWKKRNRVLNSKIIILMIFKIILSDKNRGLTINLTEFWDRCTEKDIVLPQTKPVAASFFCEAGQKVSEDIFKKDYWTRHERSNKR